MTRLRCCDDPENLREYEAPDGWAYLVCLLCGTTVARADERGELYADL